ncbi:MAG: C39 family peptidase [Candidatus Doudnabacteria bacterium]
MVLAAVFFRSQMVPSSVVLQVPFTPQAPTDNWSRNEDCEEASVTMANAYLNGQTQDQMSADDAQNAINQLKNWENINAGYNMNTGADATTHMAQGAFGILVTPILNYSEQDLKKALAEKHVVLLPLNAKILNPAKYNDNGPLYHMIVVRGYNEKEFIVNDPGTNSGDGNTYTFDTLKKASADWDQAAKAMDPNRKVALILSK